jgi:hypothetical protein
MTLFEKLKKATSEEDVKDTYKSLTGKLQPKVYELGFLRN